jgi:septum formation protein
VKKIILASESPRRKKLLQQINLVFDVQVSSVDETFDPDLPASEIVQQLALRKALDIAQKNNNVLIIGADTIVVFEDEILEKPASSSQARQMLQQLSGRTHQVQTGIALCKVDASQNITDRLTFVEKTNVTFGNLDSNGIETYVASGNPMDKAGGYGIQDNFGAIFVKRIEGDYYNVVGFPLHSFYNIMKSFAPEFLPQVKLNTHTNE